MDHPGNTGKMPVLRWNLIKRHTPDRYAMFADRQHGHTRVTVTRTKHGAGIEHQHAANPFLRVTMRMAIADDVGLATGEHSGKPWTRSAPHPGER